MIEVTGKPELKFRDYLKKFDRSSPAGVVVIRFGLSALVKREVLMADTSMIQVSLADHKTRARKLATTVSQMMKDAKDATLYLCADNDIIVTARCKDEAALNALSGIYKKIAHCLPTGISEFLVLKDNVSTCRNIAEERLANIELFETYSEMGQVSKLEKHSRLRKARSRPLVMIADAAQQSAEFLQELVAQDYDTFVSPSGPSAIREYIRRAPDCVVLDLNIPGLCGMEVSTCIKAVDVQAFIVMMSTDAIQQKIVDSYNKGADDFIRKPFSRNRLIEAISKSGYIAGDNPGTSDEMQAPKEVLLS